MNEFTHDNNKLQWARNCSKTRNYGTFHNEEIDDLLPENHTQIKIEITFLACVLLA